MITTLPPSQTLQPRPVRPTPSPLSSISYPDPATVLAILQFVGTAATGVCKAVDKAIELELEHEEKQALKELRKGAEGLKSDTLVYKVLLNAMETDTDLDKRSPYARFIQRYVMGLCSQS